MTEAGLTVYIVDDDAAIRDALSLLLSLHGYPTATFASAEDLLASLDARSAGCIVADLKMPGMSGLELQQALLAKGVLLPVVIITAHGDVPAAREAFRGGAVDFLEKPFDDAQLRLAIDTAFELEQQRIDAGVLRQADAEKLSRLTEREREVLDHAVRGLHAKEIAARLGISPRTVEVHRSRIMEKLEVRYIAELVRFAIELQR